MMRKNLGVKAVYDTDLEKLLSSLGILEDVITGCLKCHVCETPVDLDNLGTIFPHGGDIAVSCDSNRCVRIVTAHGEVPDGDRL